MWTETAVTADASTSTRATTCTIAPKWHYIRTVAGILRIVETFIGFLVCCLVNSIQCTYLSKCSAPLDPKYHDDFAGQGFVLFVGVLFLLGNFGWIIAYVLVWQAKKPEYFDWTEFIYVCCGGFFYFLAACVEAWYASMQRISSLPELNPFRSVWIACAVFAWVNFLIYTGEILLWLSKHLHFFQRSIAPVDTTDSTTRQESDSTNTHPSPPTPMSKISGLTDVEEPKVYVVDKNGYQLQTMV